MGYHSGMMRDRSFGEPVEYVIWGAWGLLALVLGLGAAFFFWAALRQADHGSLATAAVCSLGAGLVLIAMAVERPLTRFAVAIFSVSLIGCYLGGAAQFAKLLLP